MARIAGIKLEKTTTGKIKSVTFDMKKHGEVINLYLEKIGAIESKEDNFDKKFKNGITGKELLKKVSSHIDKVWKEKYGG